MAGQRYVVDGYNLIHKLPDLKALVDSDLERARDRLVDRLAGFALARRVRVTVVFDGRGASQPRGVGPRGVEVVYSRAPENADARIKSLIERERRVRSWTVVSSDNSIVRFARDYGAQTIGSDEFGTLLASARRPAARSRPARDADRPLGPDEIAEWERFFGYDPQPPAPAPGPSLRRHRRPQR